MQPERNVSAVEIQGLRHSFGSKQVLDGIDLSIGQGEIFGLLGPSGAGKTTLVNLLTGQLVPSGGKAYLLGKDVTALDADVYRCVGIMMDSFGVYERLSVYDNLKFYAKIFGVPSAKIDEVLQKTGLYEARKTAAARLSKGMRVRLNLARAVLKDAEVLFLDEPTSGLDPATSKAVHQLLLAEKQKGTAIFLTTHNMTEAESICDHVALLNNGKIVEYGTPQELRERYDSLHRLKLCLKDGTERLLPQSAEAADEVGELLRQNAVVSIHSSEPNLETIFLQLTGRRFEE